MKLSVLKNHKSPKDALYYLFLPFKFNTLGHSLKIILPFFILFLFACKKDKSVLGTDVQPSVDGLNAQYLPGLEVTGHSLPYDSICVFNDPYKYIGSNVDPQFGKTDIGLYLNGNFSLSNPSFGINPAIKSAEIVLVVDPLKFVGDQNATLNYSVYALSTRLDVKDTYYTGTDVYYTNNDRLHEATPISVSSGKYSVDTINKKAVIRIPIDNAYANSLIHDEASFANNETYQAKYKGYYIATSIGSGTEGVIFRAILEDAVSGFYLNYKPNAAVDSVREFKLNFYGSTASRYNTVKFEPNATLINHFQDSTQGATNLYLKGMGTSRVKIQIPFLKNYSDSFQVAVNRAELILNVDQVLTGGAGRYLPPENLTLLSIDSEGRETYIEDLTTSTDYTRYSGKYDEANKRYVFNLAREAQMILSGQKKNNGFYLVVANMGLLVRNDYATDNSKQLLPIRRDNYIERVIFIGANNPTLKPVFNLNYVRFKND